MSPTKLPRPAPHTRVPPPRLPRQTVPSPTPETRHGACRRSSRSGRPNNWRTTASASRRYRKPSATDLSDARWPPREGRASAGGSRQQVHSRRWRRRCRTPRQPECGNQYAPERRTCDKGELADRRLECDAGSDVLVRDECRQRGSTSRPVHALKAAPIAVHTKRGHNAGCGRRGVGHEPAARRRHDDLRQDQDPAPSIESADAPPTGTPQGGETALPPRSTPRRVSNESAQYA